MNSTLRSHLRALSAAAALTAFVLTPAAATAAPGDPPRLRFVGNLVLEHQFEPVATILFTNGDESSVGDAVLGITAGAAYPLTSDGQFELQLVGGFLFSTVNASNGSVTFWDFPIELTAHANVGRFRFGAGPALHISPMLRGDGDAASATVDYDTAVGAVGQVEFLFTPSFGLALRGTYLRLSVGSVSADASRIGGLFSIYL